MQFELILNCLVIGFIVAAPIGPIGVLCIKRSLQYGAKTGIALGFGTALADMFYASIAAFGLTALFDFFVSFQSVIQIIGIVFLVLIGIKTYKSKPAIVASIKHNKTNLIGEFLGAFFLTLTNPITILAFTALFISAGLKNSAYLEALQAVVGVFVGSMLCWIFLSIFISRYTQKITQEMLLKINKISGVIILLFAVVVAFKI